MRKMGGYGGYSGFQRRENGATQRFGLNTGNGYYSGKRGEFRNTVLAKREGLEKGNEEAKKVIFGSGEGEKSPNEEEKKGDRQGFWYGIRPGVSNTRIPYLMMGRRHIQGEGSRKLNYARPWE